MQSSGVYSSMKLMNMNKIKNAEHLLSEKMRLQVKEFELEKKLRNDWQEIREKMEPKNHFNHASEGHEFNHWLVNGLSIAASTLTKTILQKAGEQIEDRAEKGIDYISQRFNKFLKRKK